MNKFVIHFCIKQILYIMDNIYTTQSLPHTKWLCTSLVNQKKERDFPASMIFIHLIKKRYLDALKYYDFIYLIRTLESFDSINYIIRYRDTCIDVTKKLRYQYWLKQEQCHSLNYKTHNYLRRLDDQQIHHQVYLKILRYDFMDLFGYKQLYSKEKKSILYTMYF